jgi:hypothetical protein
MRIKSDMKTGMYMFKNWFKKKQKFTILKAVSDLLVDEAGRWTPPLSKVEQSILLHQIMTGDRKIDSVIKIMREFEKTR